MTTTWFDYLWNAVGSLCVRECCALFTIARDLTVLRHLRPHTRVLVGPADLFGEHVPDDVIRDIFLLMAKHDDIRFRVLTRNPNRMEQWFGSWPGSEMQAWAAQMETDWPLPNVELGVMVRDQNTADTHVGALVGSPARARFIVIDRLSNEVDLEGMTCPADIYSREQVNACGICMGSGPPICSEGVYNALREGIDEVILAGPIVGFGSSKEPIWRANIVGQCERNNVSVIRPRLPTNP